MVNPHAIVDALREHPSIRGKLAIGAACGKLGLRASSVGRPGDDAAILERAGGYDLLAGEGFIPRFVEDDPWFAGWCAVMVNCSDIAAMGGRSVAIIDQVWAASQSQAEPMLAGLAAASKAYGVPIVGGHTNFGAAGLNIAATVFGRADRLITSFDARPGDLLIAAIDHRGSYRNFDNFFCADDAPLARLQGDLDLLPVLAEDGLVAAGKDISQGGIAGTALMLAEMSGVGLSISLDRVEPPAGVDLERWLRSFPSFGFLLVVSATHEAQVLARFAERDIVAATIGKVEASSAVTFISGDTEALFWDWRAIPYLKSKSEEAIYARG
ncbi:sll0787 family AIR synthase-like protein [Fulvimarina sp. MAC8]|uniref:sll0787 family AIR synthase-like protein n=1 Tax=Fulvimarina sp. MAC8 TaxID=3162874 RepID=UPI0032EC43EC